MFCYTRLPALPSGSNFFSWLWFFGAVMTLIWSEGNLCLNNQEYTTKTYLAVWGLSIGWVTVELRGGLTTVELGGGIIAVELGGGLTTAELRGGLTTVELGGGIITVELGGGLTTAELGGGLTTVELGGGLTTVEMGGGLTTFEMGGGLNIWKYGGGGCSIGDDMTGVPEFGGISVEPFSLAIWDCNSLILWFNQDMTAIT